MRLSLKRITKSIYLKQILPTLKCSTFVILGSQSKANPNWIGFFIKNELIIFYQQQLVFRENKHIKTHINNNDRLTQFYSITTRTAAHPFAPFSFSKRTFFPLSGSPEMLFWCTKKFSSSEVFIKPYPFVESK
jgi:hypothetical protein